MVRATAGSAKHGAAYAEFADSETIPSKFVKAWVDQVEQWEADPGRVKNPFEAEVSGE